MTGASPIRLMIFMGPEQRELPVSLRSGADRESVFHDPSFT